jgi:hypothetical protein
VGWLIVEDVFTVLVLVLPRGSRELFTLVSAQADTRGGTGAGFLVEWHAETIPSDPVVGLVSRGDAHLPGS